MPGKQFSPQDQTDMIWVCRRLAAALQGGETVVSVLDHLSRSAPKGPRRILSAMRDSLARGRAASDALLELGMPRFVPGVLKWGELGSRVAEAATVLAERLELERTIPPITNRELLAYSLAFGRLGVLLGIGMPILTAIGTAAGSVPGAKAQTCLNRAGEGVRQGVDLSEALARAGAALPEMTLQMIRDGEEDSRLHHALSVVSDYLLDEAGAASSAKKEV
jgi:type II secretory pathway component PulF